MNIDGMVVRMSVYMIAALVILRVLESPLGGTMMKIEFKFDMPKEKVKSTGIYPGMFNDDLSFTFSAKNVHTTDPKEIDEMFNELDKAVARYKKDLREAIESKKPKP